MPGSQSLETRRSFFWLIPPSGKGSSQRPLGLEVHGAKPLCAYSQGLVPSFCLLPGAKTPSASLFSVGQITTICAQFLLSLDSRQGKLKRSTGSNLCSQEKQRNCYFLFLDFRGNKIGSSCRTFLEYLKTHILKKTDGSVRNVSSTSLCWKWGAQLLVLRCVPTPWFSISVVWTAGLTLNKPSPGTGTSLGSEIEGPEDFRSCSLSGQCEFYPFDNGSIPLAQCEWCSRLQIHHISFLQTFSCLFDLSKQEWELIFEFNLLKCTIWCVCHRRITCQGGNSNADHRGSSPKLLQPTHLHFLPPSSQSKQLPSKLCHSFPKQTHSIQEVWTWKCLGRGSTGDPTHPTCWCLPPSKHPCSLHAWKTRHTKGGLHSCLLTSWIKNKKSHLEAQFNCWDYVSSGNITGEKSTGDVSWRSVFPWLPSQTRGENWPVIQFCLWFNIMTKSCKANWCYGHLCWQQYLNTFKNHYLLRLLQIHSVAGNASLKQWRRKS